ncbi:MAG: fatty acid desaturase family protein [Flavobacteriales bacterium]
MNHLKSKPGIVFGTPEQQVFFKELRERVDHYFESTGRSRHANAAMVVKTVVLLGGYLLGIAAQLVFLPTPVWSFALFALTGVFLAGIGMSVMHDANHGAYSSNENVNRWVGYSLNLLGGMVMNWKMQHNVLHHTYTNIAGLDEDIDTKLALKLSPHGKTTRAHRYQWFYAFFLYMILTLYWGLAKDLVQFIQYKRVGLNKQSKVKNIGWLIKTTIVKTLYFSAVVGLPIYLGMPVWQAITGFLIMHAVSGWILSVVFQLAHVVPDAYFPQPDEKGFIPYSWAEHQLRTTMNFSTKNKWLSWYVGGLNFQIEHHLFTKICHVHYPAISEIVKTTAAEYGVPYYEKPTFGSALREHLAFLRMQGVPKLSEIGG